MKRAALLLALPALLLPGHPLGAAECRSSTDSRHFMGTVFAITLASSRPAAEAEAARRQAFSAIDRLEREISPWLPYSQTSAVNRAAGLAPQKVGPELLKIVGLAQQVSRQSDGAFDITVGPLLSLWNFRAKNPLPPQDAALRRARSLVGYHNLILDEAGGTVLLKKAGMKIDLGAIGKGYALDRALKRLRRAGFDQALLEGGGDLLAAGSRCGEPWRIGLAAPRGQGLLGTLSLRGPLALSTHGDYRKYFIYRGRRYSHLIDPRRGEPARGVESVTLLAPDGATADAWGAALFILGVARGLAEVEKRPDWAALFVDEQGHIHRSKKWPELTKP